MSLEQNPLYQRLQGEDKAIARNAEYLASFGKVVRQINVERPPKDMLGWFLKFISEARYANLPRISWTELTKMFGGPVSVKKAQGILMVMRGKTVLGFVSAKHIGRIADKLCKEPKLCRQSGGYTPAGSLFRAAVSTEVYNRRPDAPVGRIR